MARDYWREHRVVIPGRFASDVAFLDIETEKVPAAYPPSEGFRMKNGGLLRRRWSVFLAGVARDGVARILERADPETEFLVGIRAAIGSASTVVYGATREFDEMILKGRFTNARRAHEDHAFFPAMPGAYELWWRNIGVIHQLSRSAGDLPGKGISAEWRAGNRRAVLVHNLRDVVEMILLVGEPSPVCDNWCRDVLEKDDFASSQFRGDV